MACGVAFADGNVGLFASACLDEWLVVAGGALPWKEVRDRLVKQMLKGGTLKTETLEVLGARALASIPAAYLSRKDENVRLPAKIKKRPRTNFEEDVNELLGNAGGALPWRRLQALLVERLLSGTAQQDRELLSEQVLASLPEEYLSQHDEFVRLPSKKRVRFEAEPTIDTVAVSSGTLAPSGNSCAITKLSLFITPCGDASCFDAELDNAGDALVVVNFTASWCGACQQIKPDLHQLALEMDDVVFLSVDVDQVPAVADQLGVGSMPTFVFFRGRKVLGRYEGVDVDNELMMEILQRR